MTLSDQQLLRYNRQIMLPNIDIAGQEKLASSSVLVVGLGGLGSPVCLYLAAAGIGQLLLNDFDKVELSNLQRQIIHCSDDIGYYKTESAKQSLTKLNPETKLSLINHRLDEKELIKTMQSCDVVVDASDNFETRFLINRASIITKTPLVYGAAIRFEAQLSVFDPRNKESPCYQCLYPETTTSVETCTTNGVIPPLLGIIGSMQAQETLKLILGIGNTLQGQLLLYDGLNASWHEAKLNKDPNCSVCQNL